MLEGLRSTDPDLLLLLPIGGRLPVGHLLAGETAECRSLPGCRGPDRGDSVLGRTVVAEWTGAGHGLGYLGAERESRLATGQALAAVLLMCLLGLAAYGGVGVLERRIGWWNQSTSRMRNS